MLDLDSILLLQPRPRLDYLFLLYDTQLKTSS